MVSALNLLILFSRFPQAELEVEIFMEIPAGMQVEDNNVPGTRNGGKGKYVLKLRKNLYGLKQAGCNWYNMLREGLERRGFVASRIDECVFYSEGAVILTYVDDCIIFGNSDNRVNEVIQSLWEGPEKFDFTNDGDVDKYLGVEVRYLGDNIFELAQPHLIDRIVSFVGLDHEKAKGRETPVGKPLLNKDIDGVPQIENWSYRAAVGMLNYLTQTSRPDIAMAVYQCARFNENPKLNQEKAVKRIVKYLKSNSDRGIIYTVNKERGLECFVDADFAGNWDQADSENADNFLSYRLRDNVRWMPANLGKQIADGNFSEYR